MNDSIELSSSPTEEDCAAVGSDFYQHDVGAEIPAFLDQLRRQFPTEGVSVEFTSRHFAHDFGSYQEAVIKFNSRCEKAVEFAFNVDSNLPKHWDLIALNRIKSSLVASHVASLDNVTPQLHPWMLHDQDDEQLARKAIEYFKLFRSGQPVPEVLAS